MTDCPTHGTRLTGGPVQFYCYAGDGHQVRAADINHEFQTVTS